MSKIPVFRGRKLGNNILLNIHGSCSELFLFPEHFSSVQTSEVRRKCRTVSVDGCFTANPHIKAGKTGIERKQNLKVSCSSADEEPEEIGSSIDELNEEVDSKQVAQNRVTPEASKPMRCLPQAPKGIFTFNNHTQVGKCKSDRKGNEKFNVLGNRSEKCSTKANSFKDGFGTHNPKVSKCAIPVVSNGKRGDNRAKSDTSLSVNTSVTVRDSGVGLEQSSSENISPNRNAHQLGDCKVNDGCKVSLLPQFKKQFLKFNNKCVSNQKQIDTKMVGRAGENKTRHPDLKPVENLENKTVSQCNKTAPKIIKSGLPKYKGSQGSISVLSHEAFQNGVSHDVSINVEYESHRNHYESKSEEEKQQNISLTSSEIDFIQSEHEINVSNCHEISGENIHSLQLEEHFSSHQYDNCENGIKGTETSLSDKPTNDNCEGKRLNIVQFFKDDWETSDTDLNQSGGRRSGLSYTGCSADVDSTYSDLDHSFTNISVGYQASKLKLSDAGKDKAEKQSKSGIPVVEKTVSSCVRLGEGNCIRKSLSRIPAPSTQSKIKSTNGSARKQPTAPSASQAKPPPAGGGAGTKKRPAWDLKGRLQDMEAMLSSRSVESQNLQSQLSNYNDRIAMLENVNNKLSGTVAQKEKQSSHASKEIENLKAKLRDSEDEFYRMKRRFDEDKENLEFQKSTLQRQREMLEGDLTASQKENSGLKSSVAELTSGQAKISAELESTKLALDQCIKEGKSKDAEISSLKATICEHEATIEDFNVKFREHETTRRKLHNTIQELKGNIRVFCRVRPLVGEETLGNDGDIQHINFPDPDQKVLELEKFGDISLSESCIAASRRGNNKYEFTFDRVFAPVSTQEDVFEEISQLVQSALDGYNVCIFAYGQTGSGKTYTMEGPSVEDPSTRGMISRAVLQIFDSTRELEGKGWQYELEASFLEIYNETIRDLLGNGKEEVKHEIKLTGQNSHDVMVTNLTLVPVHMEQEITSLLKKASQNRAVGETKINERSSRSHSVFRLKLTGCNDVSGERCQGTLNLIDLAGSERLKESGATGQRLKETLAINTSLSNLGNVIMALGNKESHIPYRNSKLTYLLQNSLGGNSKTLMFLNVSPREEHFQETLNSLRFATKVNQCNIGTATKKTR